MRAWMMCIFGCEQPNTHISSPTPMSVLVYHPIHHPYLSVRIIQSNTHISSPIPISVCAYQFNTQICICVSSNPTPVFVCAHHPVWHLYFQSNTHICTGVLSNPKPIPVCAHPVQHPHLLSNTHTCTCVFVLANHPIQHPNLYVRIIQTNSHLFLGVSSIPTPISVCASSPTPISVLMYHPIQQGPKVVGSTCTAVLSHRAAAHVLATFTFSHQGMCAQMRMPLLVASVCVRVPLTRSCSAAIL